MPNAPSPPTTPSIPNPAESWAEVRAHDHVTRYRRLGTGRAVLLLGAARDGATDRGVPDEEPPLWPELSGAIAARFRLIVPEMPAATACADVAVWLADFLEGLGTSGVSVVATDRLCMPALELALRDAEQVARVVLVARGRAEEPGLGGRLATATRQAVVPLLVVRRALPAAEALPLVTRFLAGDGG